MEFSSRRRGRFDEEVDEFDRQQDRKRRRRAERQARKQARIEAQGKWADRRRLAKEARAEEKRGGGASSAPPRRMRKGTGREEEALVAVGSGTAHNSRRGLAQRKQRLQRHEGGVEEQSTALASRATPLSPTTSTTTTTSSSKIVGEIPAQKYIPPTLRRQATKEESGALDECTRRIVNKITLRNVAEMTREVAELFGGTVKGATRSSVLQSLSQHINRMCMLDAGPLTPIVSLPFAGLIRGLQLLHGNVVGGELVESLCLALDEHIQSNNETSASNGAMVLAHLYILNAVDSLLVSSFLRSTFRIGGHGAVCAVACALTLLRACGEKLLKEAPGQMEQALADAKAYSRENEGNVRYNTLLSYIMEIVTGHTRSAKRTVDDETLPVESLMGDIATLLAGNGASGNKRALHRIMSTTNVLTGLTWSRMLRSDKPPRWFTPAAWDDADGNDESNVTLRARAQASSSEESEGEGEDSDDDGDEDEIRAERVRQIRRQEKAISGQRLNTENKREVFQSLANASDDLEAFTILMHRDPSFNRLHDTLAVLLQCAYQEKVYNPYYTQVIQRFCSAKESCKSTLQFALWDMFKVVRVESVDVTGYVNLSCLIAHLIEGGIFALAVLRGLDLDSTNRTIGLFARILLLRLILQLPPARLAEVFFGGDGFCAYDVTIDTSVLRSNLAKFVGRYFIDERESGKWIPHFYDVVARGTPFDVQQRDSNAAISGGGGDGDARLELFMKRIHVVFKALKSGIS